MASRESIRKVLKFYILSEKTQCSMFHAQHDIMSLTFIMVIVYPSYHKHFKGDLSGISSEMVKLPRNIEICNRKR